MEQGSCGREELKDFGMERQRGAEGFCNGKKAFRVRAWDKTYEIEKGWEVQRDWDKSVRVQGKGEGRQVWDRILDLIWGGVGSRRFWRIRENVAFFFVEI